ncbi:rod shape-determining protein MreC [Caldimonas thermodepolymerans]|jgi:rod shape-determining protein MreC|uniref:rod shape-determining protein MreC n=1 Tax=Caldimonas thermodepolymerans TaxID=215580 RepID=UPI002235F74A|nr:rod shape-determining protein MreC [Caldimonas thermodepolymerans]UZG44524.1 rod shape-determining protein MreC [Caldimonas thermodepolymerans]
MPLGTLDRTPPPFFKQGPSAFTRLMIFSALAVFLMVADTRLHITQPLRAVIATVLHPIQRALLVPVELVATGGAYLDGVKEARAAEELARRQLVEQAARIARMELLERENAQLRALLELRPAVQARTRAAEVLYDAPDPFSRRVVVDIGSTHGVVLGSPVIDQNGVLGQVTRVYPLTSEVTLLTDRQALIPVLNTRTLVRGVAYGDPAHDAMELRFMAANADVAEGDLLSTSGVDGVYPPGLAVARVTKVDRRSDSPFAKITLQPVASPGSARHVLIVDPIGGHLPQRPPQDEAPSETRKKARAAR